MKVCIKGNQNLKPMRKRRKMQIFSEIRHYKALYFLENEATVTNTDMDNKFVCLCTAQDGSVQVVPTCVPHRGLERCSVVLHGVHCVAF